MKSSTQYVRSCRTLPTRPRGRASFLPFPVLFVLLLLVVSPLLILVLPSHATAQPEPQVVHSTSIVVYSDGEVFVNQTLLVAENATSADVALLTPDVGEILAVNQAGQPVAYQVEGGNITLYSLGDTPVSLSYDTNALTTKQGSVWTIDFTVTNATLTLPYESTVLYLSGTPASVQDVGGAPVLALGPGAWEVSYGLPISLSSSTSIASSGPSSPSSSSSSSRSATGSASSSSNSSAAGGSLSVRELEYAVVAALIVAVLLALGLMSFSRARARRNRSAEPLRPADLETLRFIRDRGGSVVEAEVRERFSVPRTSAWRQIKRLEQLGYVRIEKLGSQNRIELIRTDF